MRESSHKPWIPLKAQQRELETQLHPDDALCHWRKEAIEDRIGRRLEIRCGARTAIETQLHPGGQWPSWRCAQLQHRGEVIRQPVSLVKHCQLASAEGEISSCRIAAELQLRRLRADREQVASRIADGGCFV